MECRGTTSAIMSCASASARSSSVASASGSVSAAASAAAAEDVGSVSRSVSAHPAGRQRVRATTQTPTPRDRTCQQHDVRNTHASAALAAFFSALAFFFFSAAGSAAISETQLPQRQSSVKLSRAQPVSRSTVPGSEIESVLLDELSAFSEYYFKIVPYPYL